MLRKRANGESSLLTKEKIQNTIKSAKGEYDKDQDATQEEKDFKLSQLEALFGLVDEINLGEVFVLEVGSAYYTQPSYFQVTGDYVPVLRLKYSSMYAVKSSSLTTKKIVRKEILRDGRTYCGSFKSHTLIDVFQKESGGLYFRSNLYTSWCNNQDWDESVKDFSFARFEIETGEEGSMTPYNQERKKRAEERAKKFTALSRTISERFGKNVLNRILQERGQVIGIMEIISKNPSITEEMVEIGLTAGRGESLPVLDVLFKVVADRPDQRKVRRVVSKAYAWDYLFNAGVAYTGGKNGYFTDTIAALKIYQGMKLPDCLNNPE